MTHNGCSAAALEQQGKHAGVAAAFCVIHLIAGIVVALVAMGVFAARS